MRATKITPAGPPRKPRSYRLTPDRLVVGLLAAEGFLLLSERFRWFAFSRHTGWTVLVVLAAVGLTMLLMLLWLVAAVLFRLRFQYSLRSLLLLVACTAVGCSWMATEAQRARRQKEAVEAIAASGGAAVYDFEWARASGPPIPPLPGWVTRRLGRDFFSHVVAARVGAAAGLGRLEWLPQLEELCIDADATDDGLANLEGLSLLRSLSIHNSKVGDAGLGHLQHLTRLETLSLWGAPITDAGLSHLCGMKELKSLMLMNTRVADAGLAHLQGLNMLENLSLDNTQVSDAGLVHLSELRQLRWLYVNGTKVTDRGVNRLQQALPNCQIAASGPQPAKASD
jgi:hypothetical protein